MSFHTLLKVCEIESRNSIIHAPAVTTTFLLYFSGIWFHDFVTSVMYKINAETCSNCLGVMY